MEAGWGLFLIRQGTISTFFQGSQRKQVYDSLRFRLGEYIIITTWICFAQINFYYTLSFLILEVKLFGATHLGFNLYSHLSNSVDLLPNALTSYSTEFRHILQILQFAIISAKVLTLCLKFFWIRETSN